MALRILLSSGIAYKMRKFFPNRGFVRLIISSSYNGRIRGGVLLIGRKVKRFFPGINRRRFEIPDYTSRSALQ